MFNLSENYYLRKCFLQTEQIPTQSMIKRKMTPRLADIYFKSMSPKLKVIVGLEPPLEGAGSNWYVCPKELLYESRAVMKPVKNTFLAKLSHLGIQKMETALLDSHHKAMELIKDKALSEADNNWRNQIQAINCLEWENAVLEATKKNTEFIHNAFNCFSYLYKISLNKLEALFHESAIAEIKTIKQKTYREMQNHYEAAIKLQATNYYEIYTEKLKNEKVAMKAEFIEKLEIHRTDTADKIHDLNVDKHVAIEKLRQFLECQNLACQVYVALKEREECLKEINESTHKHQKEVKPLKNKIEFGDLEIHLAVQKEKKRQEFNKIWQNKVCHFVKTFQMFVLYCLNILPDHAEFFINMEKLMLLQINEALEEPNAKSIIVEEGEKFHTPIPNPHPFYLFCDNSHKRQVDKDLCPKHCTSSASQFPVIVINNRCLYAACDNFEQFTNKIKECVHGKRGDDSDFKDDVIYEHSVPIKYSSSQQLMELKLESSLLQMLQQEIPYIKEVPILCSCCGIPDCFCAPRDYISTDTSNKTMQPFPLVTTSSEAPGNKFESKARRPVLEHEREPKRDSFFDYVKPKTCACAMTAKKYLVEYLPVYMRQIPTYKIPEIPKYEMCSFSTLKKLVKEAEDKRPSPALASEKFPSKTKDVSTQYVDPEFETLCTCFSDGEINRLLSALIIDPTLDSMSTNNEFGIIGGAASATYMAKQASSFAIDRAHSLRNLINDSPDLEDIFREKDCTFE